MVDLTHIELATAEDKAYQIDDWARLFKATTWEEIKMIAEKSKYMSEAVQAMYELNADEIIRQRCLAREDYYRTQRTYEHALARALSERDHALQKQDEALLERDNTLALLRQQQEEVARLQALLKQQHN